MFKALVKITLFALIISFVFGFYVKNGVAASTEETIVGVVSKSGKGFVIEADEGDYIAKGKDLSKMVGKLVEVTGVITESDKGDTIEVKSVEEIRE